MEGDKRETETETERDRERERERERGRERAGRKKKEMKKDKMIRSPKNIVFHFTQEILCHHDIDYSSYV